MRISGRALFTLGLVALAAYAVASARAWPLKAALFPLVMGIPLLVLALAQLALDLRRKPATADDPVLDLARPADVAPALARRRTLAIFAWMAGFVALVVLAGFPLAVPLFTFGYLALQGGVGWGLSLALAAAAWGFFHALFERLLRLPFEPGLVPAWLGL
jgi:hypothetical protein